MSASGWTDLSGFDLETLRHDALEQAKALSGAVWTDHGLHDPGITLLEQLCYALSELAYFTAFDVRDHLSGPDGLIDLSAQALYGPEQMLPCRPATAMDWSRFLLGAIPELEDAGIRWDADCVEGVFRPWLQMDGHEAWEKISKAAFGLCMANRSLGDDFQPPEVASRPQCHLRGEIEIDGSQSVASVLSDVFALIHREISAGVRLERHEDARQRGVSLEDLLDGPLLAAGWIPEEEFRRVRSIPSCERLAAAVEALPGVLQVRHLELCDAKGNALVSTGMGLPVLVLPHQGGSVPSILGGRAQDRAAIDQAVRLRMGREEFQRRAFRSHTSRARMLAVEPGRFRDLSVYTSIQTELPSCYGVGRDGLPASPSPQRRVQAQQLKGYLFPFEQAMADFQETVAGLGRVFWLSHDTVSLRGCRSLQDADIPSIEELYRDVDPMVRRRHLEEATRQGEDFGSRRLEVLDHMLAGYGEEFPEPDLGIRANGRDPVQEAIAARLVFLRELPCLSPNRMGAFDPLEPERRSVWERRVGLLLGLCGQGMAKPLTSRGITLLEDQEYLAKVEAFPPDTPGLSRVIEPMEDLEPLPLSDFNMSRSMLCRGGNLDNYRLMERDGRVLLLFQAQGTQPASRVAGFRDKDAASQGALRFAKALRELDRQTEVLHVVEHVLLRTRVGPAGNGEGDFCRQRISVLLPGWNGRGSDMDFRRQAQGWIASQLPAHLLPDIHWLDWDCTRRFEDLWSQWRSLLRSFLEGNSDGVELDRASGQLRRLLQGLSCDGDRQ